jgi:polysaccharide deacetylase 2 family uncharacterized protein YibQ
VKKLAFKLPPKLQQLLSRAKLPPRVQAWLKPGAIGLGGAIALILLLTWIGNMMGAREEQKPQHFSLAKLEEQEMNGGADTEEAATEEPEDVSGVTADTDQPLPVEDETIKLSSAPDVNLVEETVEGSLPKIGEDGRKPWQVYARPFDRSDKRPRVTIIITDLGLSRVATDATIERLPKAATLAFDAQSQVVGAWLGRARQAGHETILSVPMEPFDYPRSDPGPNTLLTNLPNSDNIARLNWSLRQGSGYIGIMTVTGSRFTTSPDKLRPVLDALKRRGLILFDARVAPKSVAVDLAHEMGVPGAVATLKLDADPSPEAIDKALKQLEQGAQLSGSAIGIAAPLPVTLERIEKWAKGLTKRGIVMAPLSAVVE